MIQRWIKFYLKFFRSMAKNIFHFRKFYEHEIFTFKEWHIQKSVMYLVRGRSKFTSLFNGWGASKILWNYFVTSFCEVKKVVFLRDVIYKRLLTVSPKTPLNLLSLLPLIHRLSVLESFPNIHTFFPPQILDVISEQALVIFYFNDTKIRIWSQTKHQCTKLL